MALNSGEKRQTQFHEVKPNERSEANNWKIALRIFRLLEEQSPNLQSNEFKQDLSCLSDYSGCN